MNVDDFEKRLQRQLPRQVPGEWRQEILSAARQAACSRHAPRTTSTLRSTATENGHHAAPSLLATLRLQLATLLWPHPTAWAGLAAVWLLILGLNHATRDAVPRLAHGSRPAAAGLFMAFQEQERVLAELIGPQEMPVAESPKVVRPQPRSERRRELLIG